MKKTFSAVSSAKFKCASAIILLTVLFFIHGCTSNPAAPATLDEFRDALYDNGKILPNGDILTLDAAVKIAIVNNPTNLSAAQSVYAAKYGYYQALSAYLPKINAGYSIAHTLSRGWDLKNPPEGMLKRNNHLITAGTIQSTFLLFDGFSRELESIISHQEYQKSIETAQNIKRLLIRAVAFAYYDVCLAEEEITVFSEDLDFQNDALQQEQQRFRCGHVSKASVLNFQILAARAKSNISNAKYRKKVALHALISLMGCDSRRVPQNLRLQKISADKQPYIFDDDFYLELAVNNRPDLKEEKIMLDIASRSRQKVYAEFLPVIHIFSEFLFDTYNASYGDYRFSSAHGNQRAFSYGAEAKWNIFNGFDSFNKLRQREVLEKIARWSVSGKFLEISAEVKDACSNCKNTRFQIEIYQSMSEWVREQRDLVFSEYRNGRETITRLNEAQSALVEAQSQLAISVIQFNKSIIQLAAATGTEYTALSR